MSATVPPLSPGKRNEFHAGLEQAFGKYLVIDGEYIWKYTTRAFDFSVLANTPIFYPIEWASSKIPGFAIRASVPNFHGLTAFHRHVQRSGAFLWSAGQRDRSYAGSRWGRVPDRPRRKLQPDDSRAVPAREERAMDRLQLALRQRPCGRCLAVRGGPHQLRQWTERHRLGRGRFRSHAGSTISGGALLRERVRDADDPDQLDNSRRKSLPRVHYGSKFLKIPAPGTENDDHNPPRVAPRNLFDVAVGDDNLFNRDRYKWSLRLTAINVTNKVALYNFLSTFSGTHYVTPRALTAELGFHF